MNCQSNNKSIAKGTTADIHYNLAPNTQAQIPVSDCSSVLLMLLFVYSENFITLFLINILSLILKYLLSIQNELNAVACFFFVIKLFRKLTSQSHQREIQWEFKQKLGIFLLIVYKKKKLKDSQVQKCKQKCLVYRARKIKLTWNYQKIFPVFMVVYETTTTTKVSPLILP